jgi:predicted MFS family arabinose efflux permease
MFALGLDVFVLAGLLPGMAASFDTSVGAVAQGITAFTFAFAIGSPIATVVTAKVDRKSLAIYGMLIFALANIGTALAPSLAVLITIRAVAGIIGGVFSPAATAIAANLVPPEKRGQALALVMTGLGVSTVVGAPIGIWVANAFGWRSTLWMIAGLAIVAALAVAFIVPGVGKTPVPGIGARVAVLVDRRVLSVIGVMFLFGMGQMGILYTFIPSILGDSGGLTQTQLPIFMALSGLMALITSIITGKRLDKGTKPMTVVGIALLLLAVVSASIPFTAVNLVGITLVTIVIGLTVGQVQIPLQYQLTMTVPQHTPIVIALLNSAMYLGTAIGAALGGLVLSGAAPKYLGPVSAAVIVLALAASQIVAAQARKAGPPMMPPGFGGPGGPGGPGAPGGAPGAPGGPGSPAAVPQTAGKGE